MILNFINNLKNNLKNEFYLFNSIKFLLITSISKFFSFLVYPILSRHFTVADFGYYDIFIVFIMVSSSIGLLGLDSMIYRFLHDDSINISKKQLVSNTIFTQFLTIIFILILFYSYLSYNLFEINSFKLRNTDFIFFGLSLLGMVFYSVSEVILKISSSLKKYSILTIFNASLFIICTYIGVKCFNVDIITYLKLYSILYFLLGILGLFLIKKYLTINNLKVINKNFFLYAFPLCLLTLIPLIQVFIGQNFILVYLEQNSLGIYAAASKLTILFTLPALAVSNSTIPILLRTSKESNFKINTNKFLFFTLLFMSFCLFILTLFGSELTIIIFGENYNSSGIILSLLCLGLFFKSLHGILSVGSLIKNGTKYRFFSTLLVTIVSLYISYILIKSYGLIGLVIGIVTGNLIQLILDYYIAQKIFKIEWNSFVTLIILVYIISIFFLIQYISDISIINKILVSFILLFINLLLYFFLVFKKNIKK